MALLFVCVQKKIAKNHLQQIGLQLVVAYTQFPFLSTGYHQDAIKNDWLHTIMAALSVNNF